MMGVAVTADQVVQHCCEPIRTDHGTALSPSLISNDAACLRASRADMPSLLAVPYSTD
jgi:hypothetical protein